ncbi:MAG TPA: flippase-like domain-containing protein, partial [Tenericutes bacterium]|nr:flippase-like domain-containing protein [Mycoplasmatota bacterium]
MKEINKVKNKYSFIILIFITILVLYFSLKDNFNGILNVLINVNIFWLIIAILLMMAYWLFRSIPIYMFSKEFKPDYNFKKSLKLTMKTQFFNGVTPFASGGQPFEIYSLKKDGIPISQGTNVVIQNFIVYQIALVFLGIFGIIYNYYYNIFTEVGILKKLIIIGFIINLSVTIITFMIAFLEDFNNVVISFIINIL